ncbi:type II toxin-antitoxin system PemK/MazF family toxin [Neomoorella thermoacetica]|uniref:type II toxin-antitoxin system PemK/MazF family toxin n=1 Tax=Neomoorella thermoacetica TaxID=1525 RepID=UPI0030CDCF3E
MVIVEIPYTDEGGGKTRPALVLSSYEHNQNRRDLVVAKISGTGVFSPWDVKISKSPEAGLKKPSKVVCDHILVVNKASARKIGHIDPGSLAKVKKKIRLLLSL